MMLIKKMPKDSSPNTIRHFIHFCLISYNVPLGRTFTRKLVRLLKSSTPITRTLEKIQTIPDCVLPTDQNGLNIPLGVVKLYTGFFLTIGTSSYFFLRELT